VEYDIVDLADQYGAVLKLHQQPSASAADKIEPRGTFVLVSVKKKGTITPIA
jgi:hypothetical protein